MAINYNDYRKESINETLSFHNIDKWHNLGYKGRGIRILEAENYTSDHGQAVQRVMSVVAPESEVFLGSIGYRSRGDEVTDLTIGLESGTLEGQNALDFLASLDIVGASLGGDSDKAFVKMALDMGIIVINSAGNEGQQGVTGIYRDGGISVGAIYLKDGEIKKELYSAYGDDELDFAVLHTDLEGTSFASPVFAGMVALILSKYGKISQDNIYELMKSISIDAGETGFDTRFGWGVPVLPENGIIELLEDEDMQIKMQIGNNKMLVDGKEVNLRLAPFLYNYSDKFAATCVEVRPFFEALGFTVTWNASTQEIIIEK